MFDLSRRRLLTALALSPLMNLAPLRARAGQPAHPALEWLPVELLMALGVAPLGVADLHNYAIWVTRSCRPAPSISAYAPNPIWN